MSAVTSGGVTITRLSADALRDHIEGLAALLAESVAGGSSLGFLMPFDHDAAAAWWRTRQAAMADGGLLVWAAGGPGGVTGTVSLALESKPNGRHRGEIVKLMVRSDARGRGLARALLATAEDAALRAGVTLLLLDTATGSAADHLYGATGWTRYGIVPGYAADPAGSLEDCSFYYKNLL
ncbi:GNAT family N-acetyltransferase [Actinoallomurus bryophytorum]|uniref:Acetyltransferase (GNAT) family protein n=1 Tax=Actinoallomurus bryophytorum TaxID=1490222 RepID=A0A543CH73_9ACTN|nr:GNAT family N-acetyltransferase [Actinoallomurus bryophytorum]TQL96446.1 acetyltransferase (GNAT) family protein [Actinoallomurus bryophytorum]